jgi:hypothetical protein
MAVSFKDKLLAMKQDIESWSVTNKNAIEFLINPQNHCYLECFMGECTTARAAEHLNQPLQRVFRKVRQMLELGLIEQTRLETRTGRSIRHYRSVSDQFFIPFSERSFEEVLLENDLNFEQRFVAAVAAQWLEYATNNHGWGTSYNRGSHGRMSIQAPVHAHPQTPVPKPPNVFSNFVEWKLNPDDATALLEDMGALVERYSAKNGSGTQSFLVRVAMSPTSESV